MTLECLERVKFYVEKTRLEFLVAAENSRLNGYKKLALIEENKAQMAKVILDDLSREIGKEHARK
jgi:hypothetical protein